MLHTQHDVCKRRHDETVVTTAHAPELSHVSDGHNVRRCSRYSSLYIYIYIYIFRANVGTKVTSEEEVRKHRALESGECGEVSDEDHVTENVSLRAKSCWFSKGNSADLREVVFSTVTYVHVTSFRHIFHAKIAFLSAA